MGYTQRRKTVFRKLRQLLVVFRLRAFIVLSDGDDNHYCLRSHKGYPPPDLVQLLPETTRTLDDFQKIDTNFHLNMKLKEDRTASSGGDYSSRATFVPPQFSPLNEVRQSANVLSTPEGSHQHNMATLFGEKPRRRRKTDGISSESTIKGKQKAGADYTVFHEQAVPHLLSFYWHGGRVRKDAKRKLDQLNDEIQKFNLKNNLTGNTGYIPVDLLKSDVESLDEAVKEKSKALFEHAKGLIQRTLQVYALPPELGPRQEEFNKKLRVGDATAPHEDDIESTDKGATAADYSPYWDQATPHITSLLWGRGPLREDAISKLQRLNEKISQWNKNNSLFHLGGTIPLVDLIREAGELDRAVRRKDRGKFERIKSTIEEILDGSKVPQEWSPQEEDFIAVLASGGESTDEDSGHESNDRHEGDTSQEENDLGAEGGNQENIEGVEHSFDDLRREAERAYGVSFQDGTVTGWRGRGNGYTVCVMYKCNGIATGRLERAGGRDFVMDARSHIATNSRGDLRDNNTNVPVTRRNQGRVGRRVWTGKRVKKYGLIYWKVDDAWVQDPTAPLRPAQKAWYPETYLSILWDDGCWTKESRANCRNIFNTASDYQADMILYTIARQQEAKYQTALTGREVQIPEAPTSNPHWRNANARGGAHYTIPRAREVGYVDEEDEEDGFVVSDEEYEVSESELETYEDSEVEHNGGERRRGASHEFSPRQQPHPREHSEYISSVRPGRNQGFARNPVEDEEDEESDVDVRLPRPREYTRRDRPKDNEEATIRSTGRRRSNPGSARKTMQEEPREETSYRTPGRMQHQRGGRSSSMTTPSSAAPAIFSSAGRSLSSATTPMTPLDTPSRTKGSGSGKKVKFTRHAW
ncbi:predicted protein [Uncinocarpus reesii 1704]|uniref:Uncharacterized protein n=1 Tax=Uncinocarpus reesii (strain UAMH 1704) TaxID=336963 RepID=C4K0A8_UNCRE|nr:uncharacterized protein UREG_07922 [Uncinocarpus reesii 1704]EEP83057.1 predicted protein [Uncinocarpus reesii 1704]